jgi:hypothetical protein
MYGQGIRPTGYNPLYGFQNLNQVQASFGQIAERWTQTVARMPVHDDFLKEKRMWSNTPAEVATA